MESIPFTYNCLDELVDEIGVILQLVVIDIVRQRRHHDCDVAVGLLHRVVDIPDKLVHVEPLVLPVLHEG